MENPLTRVPSDRVRRVDIVACLLVLKGAAFGTDRAAELLADGFAPPAAAGLVLSLFALGAAGFVFRTPDEGNRGREPARSICTGSRRCRR